MINISECINKTYSCWSWINGKGNLSNKSHVLILGVTPKGFINCELQANDGFTKKFRCKKIDDDLIDYEDKKTLNTISVNLKCPYKAF